MPNSPSAPTPSLPCEQCGYNNEPERVYCHNCGSKLDRSLLPKAAETAQEHPDKVKKRIAKMTNPKSGSFGREVKTLIKVAFFSALLACILLAIQKPADLPELKKTDDIRMVSSDMMEAVNSPTPVRLSLSDDDINHYMKQRVFRDRKPTAIPGVDVSQVYVACVPGVIRIYSQQNSFGFDTYSRIDYKLEVKDGKLIPTIVGGAFGKLNLDPILMQYGDWAFGTVWDSLSRERKQMDRMLSVSIQQGRIDLVTKGLNAAK